MTLKSLARGGNKPITKTSGPGFSKIKKVKIKEQCKLKITKKSLSHEELSIYNIIPILKYSILHTGMIVLGRIFKVTDYYAIVSLPGQISGKLQATDICESYTNLIKTVINKTVNEIKTLSDIYMEGDYVICYIKDFNYNSKKVLLSLQPQLINKNLNPQYFEKGSKIILTVKSIEDHGYILETGLNNLRAFLSLKDIENKDKMYSGKQIICVVKDIKIIDSIFTITVTLKSKHLDAISTNVLSIDQLIPGVQFLLIIKKIIKNGMQVYYGEKNIGYINQIYLPNILTSYKEGQKLIGTLLYITSVTKIAYFSALLLQQEKKSLKIGDIISQAKVISHNKKGVLLQLKKDERGFISLKRTNVDFEKIVSVFTAQSVHKCKVIGYDLIAKLYICTMEKKLFPEQYCMNNAELQPGNIIEVTVSAINQRNGYVEVFAGKISGIVPSDHVSDPGEITKLKVGQRVTARVLQSSTKSIFTLKKSLIESTLPVLSKVEDAKINLLYDGSIVKITNQGILVHFFENVNGWIPNYFLKSQTQNWNFVIGQTITTIIKNVNIGENKITLALTNSKKNETIKYTIGDIVKGVVIDSSTSGIHLQIKNKNQENDTIAFLPAGHMSPCYEVGKMLASKKVAGEILSAMVFSTNPSLILSSTFVPKQTYSINDLNPGDVVLCSVKNILEKPLKVLLPVIKYNKYGIIPINEEGKQECLHENQILFGKVLKIDHKEQKINLTTKLSKIWKATEKNEDKMMTAVDVLSCYLNKISELSKNIFYSIKSISKIKLGEQIEGIIESIVDYGLILKLKNNIKGIVHNNNFIRNYEVGDKVEGSVIWINYPYEYVVISLLDNIIRDIQISQNNSVKIPIGVQLKGEILLVTNWFILVILKSRTKGILVSLPVRKHLNDTAPDLSPYQIGNKIRCYGILNKDDADLLLPICMLKSAFEIHYSEIRKPLNYNLKRKIMDENKNITVTGKMTKVANEIYGRTNQKMMERDFENIELCIREKKEKSKNIIKKGFNKKMNYNTDILVNIENKEETLNVIKCINSFSNLTMAECGFKWDDSSNLQMFIESSSDSEKEIETSKQNLQKKKLSAFERRDFERQKEREIRDREEFLADYQIPQSVDQFDRLVLSNPDSSLIWVQYMAYHLQGTEIDKARTIAQRALKTINFREENEKLNIWQAWLNLESRYGSPESLTKIFKEAIKMNNAYKIYEHMLTIYIDTSRYSEIEKIVNNMILKFKQNLDSWVLCGTTMLKIGMKNKSRQIMQRALQSLPKNKHVDLILKFAQLENKFGEIERSQTLFENILSLCPKRIDIWCSYIDSLVKVGEIEIARKTLDRAIIQPLPARKIKTLFKKYIKFEEKCGKSENVTRIKQLALKFIEEQCKKI